MKFCCATIAACVTIGLGNFALGHTGPLAVALPVSNITIDAELADWPPGLPRHRIDPEHSSKNDFEGVFRLGVDRKSGSLYIALEVNDDRVVLDGRVGKASDAQDSCEIYVDAVHGEARGMASGFFYRKAYGAYPGPRDAFEKSQRQVDAAQVARAVTKRGVTYEWKIDLNRIGGASRPRGGSIIGFDLVYFDRDDDQTVAYHLWGPSTKNRTDDSLQLADVLLSDALPRFGTVSGRLAWVGEEPSTKGELPPISIQAVDDSALRIQATCQSSGEFHATAPEGSYEVRAVDMADNRIKDAQGVGVTVPADGDAKAGIIETTRREPPAIPDGGGVLREPGPLNKEALARVVSEQMEYWQIPGASIAVIKDGQLVYTKAFGVKDVMTGEPVDDDTLFEACSLTKPIFSFAVNRLAERAAFDLDKSLFAYCPDSGRVADVRDDPRLKTITARHVLAHRSGFPNWRNDKLTIDFEPGAQTCYSGEGFEYLSEVVAHVTGKSPQTLLQDEAFAPLGMTSASATCNVAVARKSATGHDGVRPLEKWMPDSAVVAASLHVTARDYAKFLLALLHRTGMSEVQWNEMLSPQFASDPAHGRQYGLGIGVETTPYGTVYSHSGLNVGFHCYFAVYDEPKFGYVYFINNQKGENFSRAIDAYLVSGTPDSSPR